MTTRNATVFKKQGPAQPSLRAGRGIVEAIVVAAVLGFAALLFLMAMPRGREASRLVGCQRNLMQIGVGLQLYHQANRHYPTVPSLGGVPGDGPIKAMLDSLSLPDLLDLKDPANPPKPDQAPPKGVRVPGLVCQSDPRSADRLPLISYRANTGDDPTGLGGPFQPGRTMTSAEVEAADGLSYTSAFAERLIGDGQDGRRGLENYARSPGSVDRAGCADAPSDRWHGDAGADWAEASWRSTLYSHVLPPDAAPSCIANDGRSAVMGASSGHVKRVNVLMMDGSVRTVTPSIDARVWAAQGTVGPREPRQTP